MKEYVHKYHFFVFCLYLSCLYLCRVVMWKWYFILFAKAILFLCFFGFDIYPYILFHFLKCFFIILVSILFLKNSGKFLIKYVMTILFHLQYWYFLQEWFQKEVVIKIDCNIIIICYYNSYTLSHF